VTSQIATSRWRPSFNLHKPFVKNRNWDPSSLPPERLRLGNELGSQLSPRIGIHRHILSTRIQLPHLFVSGHLRWCCNCLLFRHRAVRIQQWIHCDRKKTGRWEVGALSLTKITKGRGSGKKALGSQRDVAFWDVTPEKEPSYTWDMLCEPAERIVEPSTSLNSLGTIWGTSNHY